MEEQKHTLAEDCLTDGRKVVSAAGPDSSRDYLLEVVRTLHRLAATEQEPAKILQEICRVLTIQAKYDCAWIHFLPSPENQRETPIFEAYLIDRHPNPSCQKSSILPACLEHQLRSNEESVVLSGPGQTSCNHCFLRSNGTPLVTLSRRLKGASGDIGLGFFGVGLLPSRFDPVQSVEAFEEIARDLAVALRGISIDLKRKQVEATTRQILDSISDALMSIDNDGIFRYFNRAAEIQLGRQASEIVGKHFREAFPEAVGSIFEQRYFEALRTGQGCQFEAFFEHEPYRNWYDVRVYPSAEGISIYFLVTTEAQGGRGAPAPERGRLSPGDGKSGSCEPCQR
jgi:PAS domain S-box-containing protein